MTDYANQAALDYARRSRDRHGVQIGGLCGHCNTGWPCEPFWIAHHVLLRLSDDPTPPPPATTEEPT